MRRPWNLPDVPVYSLATYDGQHLNMNICTYVSAVSMKPKRYVVAVYHGTKTLANVKASNSVVLQLLGKQHLSLVNALGKKSGSTFNKAAYLEKKKMLERWKRYSVLTDCAAVVELKKRSGTVVGDHTLFLFDAINFKTNHKNILTLDDLRAKGLVRI